VRQDVPFRKAYDGDGNLETNGISVTNSSRKVEPYALELFSGCLDRPFFVNPKSPHNLITGYRKRISPSMPEVKPERLRLLALFVVQFLQRYLKPLPFLEDKENEVFSHWLSENKSYPTRRKEQLKAAHASLFDMVGSMISNLCEWDFMCKSFIKREAYEIAKYVRLINSRSDRFKARVGGFMHLIEKQVYALKWFVKGKVITDLPKDLVKLNRFPYILETDYSSFESGFSPEYCDAVECQMWRYMLVNNPHVLHDVLRCYYQEREVNGQKVVVPRTEIMRNRDYVAKVVGARMSGEMWTSLAMVLATS